MDEPTQQLLQKYPSLKKFFETDDETESHDGREEALLQYLKDRPDFKDMSGNPGLILEAMDEFAAQKDFLINIGSDKARVLRDMLADKRPKILVELGGYVGYSAIFFADCMRNNAVDGSSHGHVWSLEFEPRFAEIAGELIKLAGLQESVSVVIGPADESLRKLKREGALDHIDLLFLDHVEDLYEQDFKVAVDELKLLPSGSCVVADNVLVPGAPKYREHVRSHAGLTSHAIEAMIVPGDRIDEIEISDVK